MGILLVVLLPAIILILVGLKFPAIKQFNHRFCGTLAIACVALFIYKGCWTCKTPGGFYFLSMAAYFGTLFNFKVLGYLARKVSKNT